MTTETITASGGTVLASITAGVADVRLNRPAKLNALNAEMFTDLLETGLALRRRAGIRAVVLSGEGRAFCAGLDVSAFDAMASNSDWRAPTAELLDPADPLFELNRGQRAAAVWAGLAVPVIAAVRGPAFGGGLQIALHADIRIVAPDATLSVTEVRWGLVPDMGGTQLLPRLVGADVAMELACTGRSISGADADRIGLATRTADDPHAAAMALAAEIAGYNPDAVRASKSLLSRSWELSLADGMAAERDAMRRLARSPNQREAVLARRQDRAPVFTDPPVHSEPSREPSRTPEQERTHHA
ncbi:MAG TPA: crotonase/enoyl-CoA hydratase family protein [Pseudonocardia sp.]|jgi:enoyl-CoA hydratase/carnithine racemase